MMISFYEVVLDNSAFALLLVALCAGFFAVRAIPRDRPQGADHQPGAPLFEVVLAVGFAILPLVAVTLARLVTGAYTSRYAISAVLGLSLLLALSLSRIAARSAVVGLASAAILLGCWTVVAARQYKNLKSDASDEESTYRFLEGISRSHPIVIAGPHLFFALSHRAEAQHAGRFVFLADVPNAIRYTGTDTVERGLLVLQHLAPLDVQDYRSYSNSHRDFLVYDPNAPFSWVLGDLIKAGRPVSIFAEGPQGRIYAVGPAQIKP